ncbi:MAG TPA: (d)CMP kinase [Parvibaculum sp.]
MIIAIDGPAASGKGTLGMRLAAHYRLQYLDTGSLYRTVAYFVLENGGNPSNKDDALKAVRQMFNGSETKVTSIRTPEVATASSKVSALPEVREALINFQREFARAGNGAVLDGRDIGTVVCPDADVKFYVTARPEVRAHRRWLELKGSGSAVSEAQVLEDTKERDRRDAGRAASPMKPADDAHLLDTSDLSIEAAFGEAVRIINKSMS